MDYYYEEPQEPEESIYDWIKEEVRVPAKPARYVSKFSGKSQVTSSTLRVKKAKAATFGRPVKKEDPRRFLKAGSKMGKGVDPSNRPGRYQRRDPVAKKEAVPRRDERPVYGLKTSKNFVVSNAVENILAAPKVRDNGGADFRKTANYGRVPAYLSEVQDQIARERELIQDMLAAETAGDEDYDEVSELSDAERGALIKALKQKWDAVNAQYQLITFKRISSSTSTVGAIKRKEECERQLAQLEKDIERLSAKGPILVVDA